MRKIRVKLLKEATAFIHTLPKGAYQKMLNIIKRVEDGMWDREIFKKLEDSDYWEFRMLYANIHYRLFAFWDKDEDSLIVATHGIVKKAQKTPKQEIKRIRTIERDYQTKKNK